MTKENSNLDLFAAISLSLLYYMYVYWTVSTANENKFTVLYLLIWLSGLLHHSIGSHIRREDFPWRKINRTT
jgi:predicted RNA-binding protein